MRLFEKPFRRMRQKLRFSFDGVEVEAFEGETLAAALSAADVRDFRTARHGDPRGMFCGMGVCFECLVTVDGRHNVRACMEPAVEGACVSRQVYPGGPGGPGGTAKAPEIRKPDILIVGAGPAGLSAALAARDDALDVVVIDERAKAGGQYFKQPNSGLVPPDGLGVDAQYREGASLMRKVRESGIEIVQDAVVWGAFAPLGIAVVAGGSNIVYEPRSVIVATGAYERGVPTPGWTLPGFMTTGAIQSLLRSHRVVPGRRVVVGGNGPLNIQVAAELHKAGATVVAVVEAAPVTSPGRFGPLLGALSANPGLLLAGFRYVARLKAAGIPIHYGHVVTEAAGDKGVQSVSIAPVDGDGRIDRQRSLTLETDIVCVGYGFEANDEIPELLGAEAVIDPATSRRRILVDDTYQTRIDGLYMIGDALGLRGSRVALAQGAIAGAAARERLGGRARDDAATRKAARRLSRNTRFQDRLWQLFKAPDMLTRLAAEDTVVCRCEGVSMAQVRKEADAHASIGNVKRATRAGMGRCQGRYCGPVIERLVADAGGYVPSPHGVMAPRPPIKPILISDIAREPDVD